MESMNARKDGTGKLNYADFSLWLGNEIHNLATFNFRHDSRRNPSFDKHVAEQDRRKGSDNRAAARAMTQNGDIVEKVIKKIQLKWKTVRGAFHSFNTNNDHFVEKHELNSFLGHLGFKLD